VFIFLLIQIIGKLNRAILKQSILGKALLSISIAFLSQAILMNIENVRFFWLLLAVGFNIERFQVITSNYSKS
jgi:hypothetical protein